MTTLHRSDFIPIRDLFTELDLLPNSTFLQIPRGLHITSVRKPKERMPANLLHCMPGKTYNLLHCIPGKTYNRTSIETTHFGQ